MSDLFRKEALDNQGQKIYGDVILAAPLSHMAIAGLLALIIIGLITFVTIGEYARKERVFGYLTPDSGLIRVVPRQTGVIESISVDIGTPVQKGDVLFEFKLGTDSEVGLNTADALLAQLETEYTELESRLALIPEEYKLSRNRLIQQINSADKEAQRLSTQINLQKKTVENQSMILGRFQNLLEQEAISSLEVSSQENRYLQASLTLENLMNSQKNISARADDIRSQLSMMPITEEKAISDLRSRLNSITQRITQAKSQGSYVITAPVAGRIASMTARPGQLATGQKALATILPSNGRMEAELLVPTRAAGFIKDGQPVRLLYDAFPYQKFGFYDGEIANVSRTIVQPQDLPVNTSIAEPVFLVRVNLNSQNIVFRNDKYPLQSGMTLSADIILEDRKIWEWVFEPIIGAIK